MIKRWPKNRIEVNKMKEYIEIELEIIKFISEDVITSSPTCPTGDTCLGDD